MNDLAGKKYIEPRMPLTLCNYCLHDYLYRELPIQLTASIQDVMLSVSRIVAAFGFSVHSEGFKYMIDLASEYIVLSDFCEEREVADIAKRYRVSKRFVRECIKGNIIRSKHLVRLAEKVLQMPPDCSDPPTIPQMLDIIAGMYRILYNFKTDTEQFDFGEM